MVKKLKLKTPDWVLEGYDSEEDYEKAKPSQVRSDSSVSRARGINEKKKGKIFKLKKCPECKSDEVSVVVGQEAKGMWECRKCKWKGVSIEENELTEEEFMKYLDEKGEEVS